MKLLKSVEKQLKKLMGKNALMLIAGAVVVYMICQYSSSRGLSLDGMTGSQGKEDSQQQAQPETSGQVSPAKPAGENSSFASADGMSTTQQNMPSNCSRKQIDDPKSLLPVQSGGNAFNGLNPNGSGDLQGVNLLQAGQHIGMVGQSLRNANLQVRSEPANPQLKVGPWMNTTMEPDANRRPLEIGAGAQ